MVHPIIEMLSMPRVLFICINNAGRSQMCEALLKQYAGDRETRDEIASRIQDWLASLPVEQPA